MPSRPNRSLDGMYRSTQLKDLFAHGKGATSVTAASGTVADHYNSCFGLGLVGPQRKPT
jgi:hypothetical protein